MGLCFNGLDAPSIFSAEQLNQHFAGISNDFLAKPVDGFVAGLEGEVGMFPLFSISPVILQKVSKAVALFSTETRGVDDVPTSVTTAVFRVIGVHLLNVFNTSIREFIFPSVWKKSLVLALNKVSSLRPMGDMRRTALLAFLSKLLECLIHLQINDCIGPTECNVNG